MFRLWGNQVRRSFHSAKDWSFKMDRSPVQPLKHTLKDLEYQITGKASKNLCLAYSPEKVFLDKLDTFVPKCVDWKKVDVGVPVKQRSDSECWIAAALFCLAAFGKLVRKSLTVAYEELRGCDFRCSKVHGGNPAYAFQYCMRNGVFRPRSSKDVMKSFGEEVPLSGYMRIPLHEQFLIRAIAQQPVLVAIHGDAGLTRYKKGIYRPPSIFKTPDHVLTAVGYNDDCFRLQNTLGPDYGEEYDGTLRIQRTGDLYGPSGLHTYCLIPYLDNHMTQFNKLLKNMEMALDTDVLGDFHPMDGKSVLKSPYLPPEIRHEIKQNEKREEEAQGKKKSGPR